MKPSTSSWSWSIGVMLVPENLAVEEMRSMRLRELPATALTATGQIACKYRCSGFRGWRWLAAHAVQYCSSHQSPR